MQTKKKVSGRSSARELSSPKVSRHQQKVSENVQIQEKKVTELITSSARKQKFAATRPKENGEHVTATNLNSRTGLVGDETPTTRLGHDAKHAINNASVDSKVCDDGTAHCKMETIFSPAFRISGSVGGGIASDSVTFFQSGDQQFEDCGKENLQVDMLSSHDLGGGGLSPEVSAIYLSMKNSKLECNDEYNQDHTSTDVCREDNECEEFDEFDPYLFIKKLPDLSVVVPTFRPLLLPKRTRSCPPTTLVLDLDDHGGGSSTETQALTLRILHLNCDCILTSDIWWEAGAESKATVSFPCETLVHSTLEPCDDANFTFSVNLDLMQHTVFVRCRPYLKDFMERVSGLFEIIIFTASQSIYAEQLLNVLDPKRKIFRHRVYRESCVFVEGNYVKDLSVLGRDLAHVIMIDNSPQVFGFQVDNGIPIESWFDDRSDKELLLLLPFLESLVGVEDVRPLIAKKFNLREKIAAAVCPINYNIGDPFERDENFRCFDIEPCESGFISSFWG